MDDSQITDARARAFAGALQTFEADADPAALTPLFAGDATVLRLDARGERTDVEQFWREYRDQFTEISTTFTHAVHRPGLVAARRALGAPACRRAS